MFVFIIALSIILILSLLTARHRATEHYISYPTYPDVQRYFVAGDRYDHSGVRDIHMNDLCTINAPASEACIAAKLWETGDVDYSQWYCSRPFKQSEACVAGKVVKG